MAKNALAWWLRGIRYLRFPPLVRSLGEMKAEREAYEVMRDHYLAAGARVHRDAVIEDWSEEKLILENAVVIDRGTIMSWAGAGRISVGEHTWIGPYNNFRVGFNGQIQIGGRCYVSQFCSFISHNYEKRLNNPIQLQQQDQDRANIVVGDDVWFGVGCTVLPGVEIGRGAVIGAGSVVTKSVPPYEIWAGAAAQKIGERV